MTRTKPTFRPTSPKGQRLNADIEFTPLIYIVGTVAHRLALHRTCGTDRLPDSVRKWAVSDPVSGCAIVTDVGGTYKGCPTSSAGLTLRDARANAVASLDALLERVGGAAFNAKLAQAAAQYAAQEA